MPKNKVSDPITDQEMAFARLVLSGGITDRLAAESVGLNPDSAAYTKSKPQVRAYMHEHRAAVEEKLVQQKAEGLHRLSLDREQVLGRLWEMANLSPEMTRNSITGQIKALSMIVAMQNLIPDSKAVSQKKSFAAPALQINASAWRPGQQATTMEPPPPPVSVQEEAALDLSSRPERSVVERPAAVPTPTFANLVIPADVPEPYVPLFASLPDMRVPFSIKKSPVNPFVRPR